jgi:hypothetical protein
VEIHDPVVYVEIFVDHAIDAESEFDRIANGEPIEIVALIHHGCRLIDRINQESVAA